LIDLAKAPRVAVEKAPQSREQVQDIIKKGGSISQGKRKPSLLERARSTPLPKGLSQGLFGTGVEFSPGQKDTGLLGFAYESLTKTDQAKFDEFTEILERKAGTDSTRAAELAAKAVTGQPIESMTELEKKAIRTQKGLNLLFGGLEALDAIPVVGAITKGPTKILKGSIMSRVLKSSNPKVIEQELRLADPVFAKADITPLATDLSKTKDAAKTQSLIDSFVQSTNKVVSPPKRFSFSQTKAPDTGLLRDSFVKRFEDIKPAGTASKAGGGGDILDTVPSPKIIDDLKNTPTPTVNQLNEALEALRVSGRQVDDLAADLKKFTDDLPAPFTQRVGASDIKPKGFFATAGDNLKDPARRQQGSIGGTPEGFPGQARKSLSSVDDTTLGAQTFEDFGDALVKKFPEAKLPQGRIDFTKTDIPASILKKSEFRGEPSLEEVFNLLKKESPTPKVQPTPKVVPKSPTKAIKQVGSDKAIKAVETPTKESVAKAGEWRNDPVKAQAKDMQEIGKEIRNTDTAKGGTHIASDLVDNIPPVKNVTAKSRNFAKENQLPIELPDQTLFERYFLSNVQDLAHRLGHLQKHLTEKGVKITDDMNAYLQREAFIGRAAARIGKVNKELGMEAGNPKGLFNRMREDNIEVEDLAEYMSAKNAADRNSQVAKRNADVPDGGSGMTTKEAADIIKRYEGNTGIQKYAEEFRAMVIEPRMKMLIDEGIISAEEAARITKHEPFYVPAKIDPPKGRFDIGKGFSVTNKGVKGLRGSTRTDRTNSVMQAVADYHNSIRLAEKNKSLTALAKLIREVPDDSFWKIRGVKHKPQYNKQGEIEFLSPLPSKEDNVVSFFENGKRMEIEFADGALAKVFTEQGVTPPIPGLRKINNYLRAVNTVIAPEFMITNAIRDLQTALILAGGEKGMVVAAKIVKDYRKAGAGIWGAVRKGDNTGWAKTYNEMIEAGGRTGWFDMMTVPEQTKQVSKSISRYNSTKTSDSLMRAVDSTGKLISDMNEVAEMSVRVSAYKQLVDSGMTKAAAANYSKNMTVNFNKRGNWGLTMNSLYLFANAGVQGSARIIMAQKNPTVRKITAGVVGSSYALNELNYMINPEGYERIQDFEKERNLIVMLPLDGNKYDLPGISGDPRTGYYLKNPLPYGFNVFKVAGDVAYDVVNKKKSMAEGMATLLSATNAAFNPISSGSGLQMVSPTVTDPIASLYENKNWFGGPVMPDQPAFAPQVRQSDRYFSGARDMSVGTAQFLNRLSGGNKVTAGTIDISPEAIDLVIDTLGGGLGNFLATSLDTGINVAQGEMPVPEEMPFVRKLIDKPFERGEQSTVFNLLEKSSDHRMSAIETNRFVDNLNRGLDMGQIEVDTYKRVLDGYITNAARNEAGEYVSLVEEGKQDEAIELLQDAPPGIAKEIVKILKKDLEDEIKELEK
jgi:hypothetical protein